MLADAFLVVAAAIERTVTSSTSGLAPLTSGEIQRLSAAFGLPTAGVLGRRSATPTLMRHGVTERRGDTRLSALTPPVQYVQP